MSQGADLHTERPMKSVELKLEKRWSELWSQFWEHFRW